MKINQHIPQTLHINRTETSMYTQYPNQPMSCNKCGHSGHRGRYCNRDSKDFKNAIDIGQSDSVDIENCTDSNVSDDDDGDDDDDDYDNSPLISVNNVDVHMEASQKSNVLECTKCDYKCKYENILKEHMLTHTGENPLRCPTCDLVSKDRSENEKHMLTHTNLSLALLRCTECAYECLSKDTLSNHLKTHKIYACEKCDYKSNSLNGLNGHVKIHNQATYNCSVCEYRCTSLNKLNTHMKTHTDEICPATQLKSVKDLPSENTSKRCLSVSPEVVDSNTKIRKKGIKKR